jgi:phage gpG-like protein
MLFRLTRDDLTPALSRVAATARNPIAIMRAAGMVFKSITEGNFNSAGASFRPIPWKPKYDGSPSNLQKSTTMARSFHLEVTATTATVSNPMPYAAIHQFGGEIRPKSGGSLMWTAPDGAKVFAKKVTMPARPFFPVVNGKLTPAAEALILKAAERALLRQSGVK